MSLKGELKLTEQTSKMPKIAFGPSRISRLIVGGNQQSGVSHNLRDLDLHMAEYFSVNRTIKFLQECITQGIDTWQANYSEKTRDVITKFREEHQDINIIPLSAPQLPDLRDKQLHHVSRLTLEYWDNTWENMLKELKPIGIALAGSLTDVLWKEGEIEKTRDFLKKIRDAGVQVGVSTHMPEVIEYIDEEGWDVDFYLASLYQFEKSREEVLRIESEVPLDVDRIGSMQLILPSELPRMCDTINKTSKTCIAFKIFAAGRVSTTPKQVSDTFEYVFKHVKPTDAVCVGMYPRFHKNMVKENTGLVKKFGLIRE